MSAERFKIKCASFASIFPAVAGPAMGGFAGRAIGTRIGGPGLGADLGMLFGGVTGGTTGQLLKEKFEDAEDASGAVPPGAPYNLDATSQDIPTWALQGAHLLQPQLKQGAHKREHESAADVIIGEVPGANPLWEGVKHGPGAAARAFGGMALGGVPGGLVGTGLAKGIEHLAGKKSINVPGLNLSLSDVLGSIGGALGATKGLRLMQS